MTERTDAEKEAIIAEAVQHDSGRKALLEAVEKAYREKDNDPTVLTGFFVAMMETYTNLLALHDSAKKMNAQAQVDPYLDGLETLQEGYIEMVKRLTAELNEPPVENSVG